MEISRHSQIAKIYFKTDYLKQTCQDTKDVVDRYLEAVNKIMISFQSALDPYLRTHDDGINYFSAGSLLYGQLKHIETQSVIWQIIWLLL